MENHGRSIYQWMRTRGTPMDWTLPAMAMATRNLGFGLAIPLAGWDFGLSPCLMNFVSPKVDSPTYVAV